MSTRGALFVSVLAIAIVGCKIHAVRTDEKKGSYCLVPTPSDEYADAMEKQFIGVLENPAGVQTNNESKRSPFEYPPPKDVNIGVTVVVQPHPEFLDMIKSIQQKIYEVFGEAAKVHTRPHITIATVVLDQHSPVDFNNVVGSSNLIPKVREYFSDFVRSGSKITLSLKELKLPARGCVTLQFQPGSGQGTQMSKEELKTALGRIPSIHAGNIETETNKFKNVTGKSGMVEVTLIQKMRLELGGLGSQIKDFRGDGAMVVADLIKPHLLNKVPLESRRNLWKELHAMWLPLQNKQFSLTRFEMFCYVGRSLDPYSSVICPHKEDIMVANTGRLMDGVFIADNKGNPQIDVEVYNKRRGRFRLA